MASWAPKAAFFFLAAVALAAASALLFGLVRHGGDADPLPAPDFLPPGRDLSLTDIRQTAVKDGKVQWTLSADKAWLAEAKNRARLQAVKGVLYPGSGEGKPLDLSAGAAVINTKTNDVSLRGGVKLLYGSYVLETESATYKDRQKRVRGDQRFLLSGGGLVVAGDAFVYDLDAGRVVVTGNVEAAIDDVQTP
ncbi:MAG: LPS export ABC transporter periplasmic protein LptC [Deltaproteobacteria bacterium]|nr:LPS export ABC transporter periplasmic protein LptC [Deltaproteobacteria bacterium]